MDNQHQNYLNTIRASLKIKLFLPHLQIRQNIETSEERNSATNPKLTNKSFQSPINNKNNKSDQLITTFSKTLFKLQQTPKIRKYENKKKIKSFDHFYQIQQKIGNLKQKSFIFRRRSSCCCSQMHKKIAVERRLFRADRLKRDHCYAVKVFRTGDPEIVATIKQTFQNNRILNECPKIIKAYELFIDEQKEVAHLVMEYCDYPSLQKQITKNKLNVSIIKDLTKGLAEVINLMHSKGICHRDLKPDNILVSIENNGKVLLKIIDFGVSKRYYFQNKTNSKVRDMWTRTGTILYSAPEIFEGGGYNKEVDIWSVGVMLFQMLCGHFPYHCETNMDTIEAICSEEDLLRTDPNFRDLDCLAQDLLRRVLKKDPTKRLSASEMQLHPWTYTNQFQFKQKSKCHDDSVMKIKYELPAFQQSINIISFNKFNKTLLDSKAFEEDQEIVSLEQKQLWLEQNLLGSQIHYVDPNSAHKLQLNSILSTPSNSLTQIPIPSDSDDGSKQKGYQHKLEIENDI